MNIEEKHRKNIDIYLQNGGSQKICRQYESPTLANRSKISFLISELNVQSKIQDIQSAKSEIKNTTDILQPTPENPKPKFLGFISQYPVELHKVYQNAYQYWIESCGLKVELNQVPEDDQEKALEIQIKIFEAFKNLDKAKEILDYYNEHKRVMPVETKLDISEMSDIELVNRRNNLRGLIIRRKSTLQKRISELPDHGSADFRVKQNFINRKTEELRELELQMELLNEKIKSETGE